MARYWRVKKNTTVWDWCLNYANNWNITHELRRALARELLGKTRKLTEIVNGPYFVGVTYKTGKLPEDIPDDRLKLSSKTLDNGTQFYIPHKKTAASKRIAERMSRLKQEKTSPLCKMINLKEYDFSSSGIRFNDPGLKFIPEKPLFLLSTIDEYDGCESLTRISDIDYEKEQPCSEQS